MTHRDRPTDAEVREAYLVATCDPTSRTIRADRTARARQFERWILDERTDAAINAFISTANHVERMRDGMGFDTPALALDAVVRLLEQAADVAHFGREVKS